MTEAQKKSAKVVDLDTVKRGAKKRPKCPICTKPSAPDYRPFCSKRCADIDLGKWLDEGYRIPTNEGPGAEGPFDDEN